MLTFGITGDEQVDAAFKAIATALDVTEILDQSAALLLNRIRDRFLRQMDEEGKPWKPSMAAIARAKSGRGGGTLYDTGRMFHSIQVFASGLNERNLGTDVPYAPTHQFGKKGMPVRRFIGVNEEDVAIISGFIHLRVQKILGAS